uniref:Capsid protein n=1 Tax=Pipistrellus pipistrellus feces associated gemykolovirus TaxID=3140009 RepID=A0AAU6S589_9VIRU
MPYRSYRRSSLRRRAPRSTRRYSNRSKPRRLSTRRAPYRRRSSRRMSKRALLNVTSRKKRDEMSCYTNSTAANQTGSATYAQQPAVVSGGLAVSTCAAFLWIATGRDNTLNSGGGTGNIFNQATRTSTTPYMVGLKEKIEIQCNNGMPWQWRRICFTWKGSIFPDTASFSRSLETSNGWVRLMNQLAGTPTTAATNMNTTFNNMFKGSVNVDWTDPMTATVDNTRVSCRYDRTITLASGNEDGFIRNYSMWHPMKKTLVYDDDESGGGTTASSYSTYGRKGMGDFYVVDLFRARSGSATTDQLTVNPTATLYWHEK